MMMLALLGVLLLALYAVASTSVVVTIGPVDAYQDTQAWADELDASLDPMAVAVEAGLIPAAWPVPAALARTLEQATAEVPSTKRLTLQLVCDDDDIAPDTLRCAA